MKILFISRWFPFPTNNGSKLRIANLLRALSQEFDITLISYSDDPKVDEQNPEIRSICSEVYVYPWKSYNPYSLRSLFGFFSSEPRFIVDTFSSEIANHIQQIAKSGDYHAVVASQIDMASYAKYFGDLPAVFEELESGLFVEPPQQAESIIRKFRNRFTWYKRKEYLRKLITKFQTVTVVSNQERDILKKICPDYQMVQVIPNCIDLNTYSPADKRNNPNSLIFTGSFRYDPNYDAMAWFTGEIFPLILRRLPDAALTITGDHANKLLPDIRNVEFTGFVDDIKSLISRARCSLVPIRAGGGTRLKILEAMALGTPVVSTSKGAEGLDAQNGIHLMVADTPHEFADAVIRVMVEPDLREKLATNATNLVKEKYDYSVVMPEFLDLVKNLQS